MTTRKWSTRMPTAEVVGMPGEFRPILTLRGKQSMARGRMVDYTVEVYECGEYAGDVHRRDGRPIARNCFKQPTDEAVENAMRWWRLKGLNNITEVAREWHEGATPPPALADSA